MEIILNRFRGTGDIFYFGSFDLSLKYIILFFNYFKSLNKLLHVLNGNKTIPESINIKLKLIGTNLYMFYIILLYSIFTTWYIGLIMGITFIIGESMGFGKWVGYLCYPNEKRDMNKAYADLEGIRFPFIHKTAELLVKETTNYKAYCNIALFLRGFYWGLLIYLPLTYFYIEYYYVLLATLTYGIGFPLACYLSTLHSFNFKYWKIHIVGEWESQEIYYGFIHCIVNVSIITLIILKG